MRVSGEVIADISVISLIFPLIILSRDCKKGRDEIIWPPRYRPRCVSQGSFAALAPLSSFGGAIRAASAVV